MRFSTIAASLLALGLGLTGCGPYHRHHAYYYQDVPPSPPVPQSFTLILVNNTAALIQPNPVFVEPTGDSYAIPALASGDSYALVLSYEPTSVEVGAVSDDGTGAIFPSRTLVLGSDYFSLDSEVVFNFTF